MEHADQSAVTVCKRGSAPGLICAFRAQAMVDNIGVKRQVWRGGAKGQQERGGIAAA
jgi:hypothetical protein